ncbi:MAG: porin family protein [Gemmatimonadota bacterium]|nr:porin family protein [Gemmatimonadota bacterium]
MNRFVLSTFVASAALFSAAGSASAQGYNPFQIGAAAGIAFPTSDLGRSANTGYNVTVAVGYKPEFTPIGIRAEAAYNQFGSKVFNGNVNIPAFTGNLVFGMPMGTLSPYAIGGAGLYRTSVDRTGLGTSTENDFGFNIGGGIKIPLSSSFETFVEARYHRVSLKNNGGTLSFVPVTFGVMF